MGTKLGNAPICYAIGQVVFNSFQDIESYIPAVQAKLREADFPDYHMETVNEIAFPSGGFSAMEGNLVPTITTTRRFVFGNMNKTQMFTLTPNMLLFQTTDYDTFSGFRDHMVNGLKILLAVLGESNMKYYERIGMRVLNIIIPSDEEKPSDYLHERVLGQSMNVEHLIHTMSETVSITPLFHLVSRVLTRVGMPGLPPDLADPFLTLKDRFTGERVLHSLVDLDASRIARAPFSAGPIGEVLDGLHSEIEKAFLLTVTEQALLRWA